MRRDDAYLLDMLLAARKIRDFTQGVSLERFQQDELMQHAIMRLISDYRRGGPGKSHKKSRQAHPEIPWRQSIGMRHRLVRE